VSDVLVTMNDVRVGVVIKDLPINLLDATVKVIRFEFDAGE
jgi:hypothetical protein